MSNSSALPPEIWEQIADHLPGGALETLYGLNRAFLDMVLSARYASLLLSARGLLQKRDSLDNRQWKLIEHVCQDHIAYRVRRLTLMVSADDKRLEDWKMAGFSDSNPRRIGHFLSVTFANLIILQERFAKFSNLETLVLLGTPWPRIRPTILHHIYFGVGEIIRRLKISARMNELKFYLPLPKFVPFLSELTIEIKESNCTTDAELGFAALANLIRSVSSTLEVLNITTGNASWKPVQAFMDDLGKLPGLRTFTLNVRTGFHELPNLSFLSSIVRFLNENTESITEVKIPAAQVEASRNSEAQREQQKPVRLRLPKLRALTIAHACMPHALSYIRDCAETVTELHLQGLTWKFRDIEKFVRFLSEPLEMLRLTVYSLNPQLLQCIADGLAGVQHLVIGFQIILGDCKLEPSDMMLFGRSFNRLDEFQTGLQGISITKACKLRHLGIQNLAATLLWEELEEVLDMLESSLPNIQVYKSWRDWDPVDQVSHL